MATFRARISNLYNPSWDKITKTLTLIAVFFIFCGLPIVSHADQNPETLFVMDVSGSMGDQVNGVEKLQAAKNAVNAIAPSLSSNGINLGLMHFSGCGGVEYPLAPAQNNQGQISQLVNSFSPGGGTPLADALEQAGRQMQGGKVEKRIVLLSDGKETCGGDPVAVASRFASSNLKIHVIGFDVSSDVANRLRKIATAGGGDFNLAQNAQQLEDVFKKISDNLQENLLEKLRSCVELGGGKKEESQITPSGSRDSKYATSSGWGIIGDSLNTAWESTLRLWAQLLAIVTPSRAWAKDLPDWVQEPSSEFPSSSYLTSVGSGSSLAGAKNKAKKGLIETLSQKIETSQTMKEATEEISTNESNSFHQNFEMETEIDVSASGELVGAQIEKSESVFADGQMTYYALAIMDIQKSIDRYIDKRDQARQRLRRIYQSSQRTNDSVNRLRLLAESRNLAANVLKYNGYIDALSTLGETGSEMTEGSDETDVPTPGKIDNELNKIFSELSISLGEIDLSNICPGTDFDRQMNREVSQRFTDLGFRTSDNDDSLILVDGYVSMNYTSRGRKSDEGIRWNLTLNLTNNDTGNTFASINESRVTTGLDKTHVASRTRFEITNWIKNNLNETIKEKLLST